MRMMGIFASKPGMRGRASGRSLEIGLSTISTGVEPKLIAQIRAID
eukprot:05279.XXX_33793_33930_1 [CDS] Oithona nana genome sequencing.